MGKIKFVFLLVIHTSVSVTLISKERIAKKQVGLTDYSFLYTCSVCAGIVTQNADF